MRIKTISIFCLCSVFIFLANLGAEEPADSLWQKSIGELKNNLSLLLQENQELRQKEQSSNKRIFELESLLKKSTAEKNQIEILQQEKTALEKQLADAHATLAQSANTQALQEELSRRNSQITKLETIVQEYSEENFQLVNKLKAQASQEDNTVIDIQNLKNENFTLEKELTRLSEEKLTLEENAGKLKDEFDNLQNELFSAQKISQELKNKNSALEIQIDNLTNEKLSLEEELASAAKALAESSQQKETEENLSQLKEQLDKLASEKQSLENEISSLKEQLSLRTKAISDLNREQLETQRENAILESLLRLKPREVISSQGKAGIDYEMRGYNFARQGKLSEAVDEYKKAINQSPNNKDLYYNLAYIYSRLHNNQLAIENYKKVLQIDPQDKEALFNLSRVYEDLNDRESSQRYYESYLRLERR